MALERDIPAIIRETQERVFRICQANGLTLKAISLDAGIPYSSLRSYAGNSGATSIMGIDVLYQLVGVVPNELLSLLLPSGNAIFTVPDDVDHDEIEEMARDYLATKAKAHRADSPEGPAVAACERNTLNGKVARLRVAA